MFILGVADLLTEISKWIFIRNVFFNILSFVFDNILSAF